MLISFYPGSISLMAGYSEGLNMFLISLSLYFLLIKRNYFLSSLLMGISTSVRIQSLFFSIGFLICLLLFERKNIKPWQLILYTLLSISGIIFYSFYLFLKFKQPFAWYLLNRYAWGNPDFIKNSINSFKHLLNFIFTPKILLPKHIHGIFTILFIFVFLKFKEKTSLFIITLTVFILTIISIYTQTPSNLSCLTRLFLTDFPLFILLSRFLKNDLIFSFILILFSIELLLFSLLFNYGLVSLLFPKLIFIP